MTTTARAGATHATNTTHAPHAGGFASALELLEAARGSLADAGRSHRCRERWLRAQLAALRAGAALIAVRRARTAETPDPHASGRARSVWSMVAVRAPEMGEWAAFFAETTRRRHDVEQGTDAVAPREADDLLRDAAAFVGLVERAVRPGPHGDLLAPTLIPLTAP